MKILHVVKSLKQGGAETMLHNVCSHLSQNMDIEILTLSGLGATGERLEKEGYDITDAGLPSTRTVDISVRDTCKDHVQAIQDKIVSSKPDIVMSWLMKSDGLTTLAIKGLKQEERPKSFYWNVQGITPELYVSMNELDALKRMSHDQCVDGIVYCGNVVKDAHENFIGYSKNKGIVIPNAVDRKKFTFDKDARLKLRSELGISEGTKAVIMAARYKEMKDVPTFIKAMVLLSKQNPNTCFVMCGQRMDKSNIELLELIEKNGGNLDKFKLLGVRDDMPALYSASDVFCLPSKSGEGLSLALVESMSSGLFPYVTPVGDSARVVANDEFVCQIGDAEGFAGRINQLLQRPKDDRDIVRAGIKQRSNDFSIENVGHKYGNVFDKSKQR